MCVFFCIFTTSFSMDETLHVAYKKYTIKRIGSDRKVANMRRNAIAVAAGIQKVCILTKT